MSKMKDHLADMPNYLRVHNQLLARVSQDQYYPEVLVATQVKHPDVQTENDVIEFWNTFWWNLPDVPAIHSNKVFYAICDVCEGCF